MTRKDRVRLRARRFSAWMDDIDPAQRVPARLEQLARIVYRNLTL